ncbi:MAG: hypothetical protein CMB11_02810 [Euryarchaeota archaeon]|nr:hypothetical protein [Euryarchaeota archaeon]
MKRLMKITSNRPDENRFWWTCRANGFTVLQLRKSWRMSNRPDENRFWWTCRADARDIWPRNGHGYVQQI